MIRSTTYPPQTRIGVDRETTVHDSLRHSRRGDKLTDSRPNWPSYLLNFAKIDVRVRMVAAASTRNSPHVTLDALFVTNQELLGLVSFLSHSTALETVRINLLNPTALPQDSDLVSMLRPLARLAPNINIDIVNVPSDIKDQVLHEKESYNGTEHLYDDFRKTHTNLKELEDFQQAHFETKDRFTEIEQQRLAMERPLEVSGFVNDHVEKQLIEATTKAKYFLASGIIDKVNRQARQKAKEVKQQAAKKIDELEGLRQKFVEIEKAAQKTSTTTTT